MFFATAFVVSLILAGVFIRWAVNLTLAELRKHARKKLAVESAKKWAIATIKSLANDPNVNKMKLAQLDELADKEGYTHVTALVDKNGEIIGDVELAKKKDRTLADDENVKRLFEANNGVLIIEK